MIFYEITIFEDYLLILKIGNDKVVLSKYKSVKIYWLSVEYDWLKYLKRGYCKSVEFHWLLQWKLTDLTAKTFFPLI